MGFNIDFSGKNIIKHDNITKIRSYFILTNDINNYHSEAWKLFCDIWEKASYDITGKMRRDFIKYLNKGGTDNLMKLVPKGTDVNHWSPIDTAMHKIKQGEL